MAAKEALYAVFWVAFGKEVVVIDGGLVWALTVMLNTWLAVCVSASVTWTVKPFVPLVTGVPEIVPVVGSSESPVGRLPEVIDQE